MRHDGLTDEKLTLIRRSGGSVMPLLNGQFPHFMDRVDRNLLAIPPRTNALTTNGDEASP